LLSKAEGLQSLQQILPMDGVEGLCKVKLEEDQRVVFELCLFDDPSNIDKVVMDGSG
jgi:hypothetical protein